MIGARYRATFSRLANAGEGAFIPFLVLGDPDPVQSARLVDAVIAAGADGLELGLPFSDPVADGPVIQAAAGRALAAGATVTGGFASIGAIRARHPEVPIGLLVYANLVVARGLERFYHDAAAAGVDSVLVADVPTDEIDPFAAAAAAAGVAPVLIAPPNADPARRARILAVSRGYCYLTSRAGVTGVDDGDRRDLAGRLAGLAGDGAPPVIGFGIATPDQVRAALGGGARGVIVGSALTRLVADHRDDPDRMIAAVAATVGRLKAATRGGAPGTPRGPSGIASDPIPADN